MEGLLIRTFGLGQAEDSINIERQNMEVTMRERDRSPKISLGIIGGGSHIENYVQGKSGKE